MKLVIDSSVLVAAFRGDEPQSRQAFHVLEEMQKGKRAVYLPVSVVLETVAAIRRRTNSSDLARKVGLKKEMGC